MIAAATVAAAAVAEEDVAVTDRLDQTSRKMVFSTRGVHSPPRFGIPAQRLTLMLPNPPM